MRKRSLVFLLALAFVIGTLFSTNVTEASVSVSALQKQIKSLQATIASNKKLLAAKDKQINSYKTQVGSLKSQISQKDKDISKYKANAGTPLSSKLAYQGFVHSGTYEYGKTSVPALLSFKGVRYAPIDLMANLINSHSSYNKKSDTVFLGTDPNGTTYMSDVISPFNYTYEPSLNKEMTMGGKTYNKGYSMFWSGIDEYMVFNLNKQYTHITGLLGFADGSNWGSHHFKIYGDEKLLASYDLAKDDLPTSVDLDVTNVQKLKITCEDGQIDNGVINFANVIIK
ncbi:hypothetical protein CEF21_20095 [Bacillus sp. FJAT-42376]|uniref:NPCBM/NEW2 domain-containing protein n=1 Tax=Bacillus sp. FJAT-42376 TaxID=2014076 RepID=UPI000F4E7555|nr:NPCBM/NEW2 domain-containing protein [Bacillus sp. FJAT-42376]AZB44408.1 hypothetical protein CEF21_20095 [Bacillus sp. FJAT-42376]